MKVIHKNPTIVQTGWEPRKSPAGKVCYLIAAAFDAKESRPTLLVGEVFIPKIEKGSEENAIKSRTEDLKDSLLRYEAGNTS